MTAQTFKGFLLTRNWRDTAAGIELELWFSTSNGPLCALVSGERSVFFLPREQALQAAPLLVGSAGGELGETRLRNFAMAPVTAVYCQSYRRARQLADQLRGMGLEPLETEEVPASDALLVLGGGVAGLAAALELQDDVGEVLVVNTKGFTGHTLGAAGGIESIITWLSIRHGFRPGTCNLKQLDDNFHCHVNRDAESDVPVSHTMNNNFGFGGNNTSVVMGQPHD